MINEHPDSRFQARTQGCRLYLEQDKGGRYILVASREDDLHPRDCQRVHQSWWEGKQFVRVLCLAYIRSVVYREPFSITPVNQYHTWVFPMMKAPMDRGLMAHDACANGIAAKRYADNYYLSD